MSLGMPLPLVLDDSVSTHCLIFKEQIGSGFSGLRALPRKHQLSLQAQGISVSFRHLHFELRGLYLVSAIS